MTKKRMKISMKRVSVAKKMRYMREFKNNSFHKEKIIKDSPDAEETSRCVSELFPGTSHNTYQDTGNTDNNTLASQSLSFTDTFSQLSVDACDSTHKIQAEIVIDIFNDDSVGSLADIRQFCENTSLSNEAHAYTDERNGIDNDALTSQSLLNVFPENSVNACAVMDVENIINDRESIASNISGNNADHLESDINEMSEIENIDLHVDSNIDAGRLCSAEISGRCIVDFGYVFAELQRLSTHWIGECRFTDLVITKTIPHGLKTQFFVECQMCRFKDNFWSEPTDDKILDVNRGAVCGTILTGTGHKQLEEFLAAVDVPCMSSKTYIRYHNEMSEAFAAAAEEEIHLAGEEERQLAIKRGDVIDGIPHIPVITDGSWMKRSYRSGSYDSPSGAAIITGYYSKKVLFVGVRNKYCIICARAAKLSLKPKNHKCYKNWGSNQSSTSMESDIILEGFRHSIEMHGLIYSKYIGDGDSNVLKKLRDFPLYLNIVVEKIECTNHLLRNMCNKIREAGSSGDRNISKLKKVVTNSVMKIRNAVVKAITFRRNSKRSRGQKKKGYKIN